MTDTVAFKSGRRKDGPEIIVDAADWDAVRLYTWRVYTPQRSKTSYARGIVGGKHVLLHRYILGAPSGSTIDHIDGNALNNSRNNLRLVSQSENVRSAWRLPGRYLGYACKNVVRRTLKDGSVRTYEYHRSTRTEDAS